MARDLWPGRVCALDPRLRAMGVRRPRRPCLLVESDDDERRAARRVSRGRRVRRHGVPRSDRARLHVRRHPDPRLSPREEPRSWSSTWTSRASGRWRGRRREELLDVYLTGGHRVIALADDRFHDGEPGTVRSVRRRPARGRAARGHLIARGRGSGGPPLSPHVHRHAPSAHENEEDAAMIRRHPSVRAGSITISSPLACTGEGDGDAPPGEDAAAAPATIAVSLTEFAIGPNMIHAPAGQALLFEVTNDGAARTHVRDRGRWKASRRRPRSSPAGPRPSRSLPWRPAPTAPSARSQVTIKPAWSASSWSWRKARRSPPAATGPTGATGGAVSVEDMLDGHEAGVAAFPAETEGLRQRAARTDGRERHEGLRAHRHRARRGRPLPACS